MRVASSGSQSRGQTTVPTGRFKDLPALPESILELEPSTSSLSVERTARSTRRDRQMPPQEEVAVLEPDLTSQLASWTVEKDSNLSRTAVPTAAASRGPSQSKEIPARRPRRKKISLAGQMVKRANETISALTSGRQEQEGMEDAKTEAEAARKPSTMGRKHRSCVSLADECGARPSSSGGRSRQALLQSFTQGLSKIQRPPVVSSGVKLLHRGRMKSVTSLQEDLSEPTLPDETGTLSALLDSSSGLKNASAICLGDLPSLEGDTLCSSGVQGISTSAPAALHRKGSRLLRRPTTASSASVAPIQTYLVHLLPPPQGLPVGAFEGRKSLATSYVQRRMMEEKSINKDRRGNKSTAAPFASPTASAEEVMERFESEALSFMHEELERGVEAARYRELRLADVFIEARRELGLESTSARLHQMFDMPEPHSDCGRDTSPLETEPTMPIANVWPSLPPPSAWDTTSRKISSSLSPAPRRRRPRTSPVEPGSRSLPVRHRGTSSRPTLMEITAASGEAAESTPPSIDGSSICSFEGVYIPIPSRRFEDDNKEEQLHVLTPEFFSSRLSPHCTYVSLPPTPPRSSESHFSGKASSAATWERLPLEALTAQHNSRAPLAPTLKDNISSMRVGPVEGKQFEVMLKEAAWSQVPAEC